MRVGKRLVVERHLRCAGRRARVIGTEIAQRGAVGGSQGAGIARRRAQEPQEALLVVVLHAPDRAGLVAATRRCQTRQVAIRAPGSGR